MVIFGPDNFRTTCTQPLSFRSYSQYFLVPHIACGLISQDKGTDLEGHGKLWSKVPKSGPLCSHSLSKRIFLKRYSRQMPNLANHAIFSRRTTGRKRLPQ